MKLADKIKFTFQHFVIIEDLCVAGVCRICVVEVEGMRTLQASCAFPITAPIKIKNYQAMQLEEQENIL
ncbi:MAG: 2Fe-2S iron-sulfur cluster-binding protein [Ignavibacteriales bacterium]|nr:2Fe-2S iron-sulfur cluster-binding protein [Ignavibacteriales bacterium]